MIRTYLLDTNTFRYIAKGTSTAARSEFQKLNQDRDAAICISVITEAEVRYGIANHSVLWSRRSAIEGLFANLMILPWNSEEAAAYAQARAKLERKGITVATMDMLIAAQAIAAGATLVTRDKVFDKIEGLGATVNWATDL